MKYRVLLCTAAAVAAFAFLVSCQAPLGADKVLDQVTSKVLISGTTKIEAESYSGMSGIITEACSEGTLNVGAVDSGDWMIYPITISSAGNYVIQYRVASIYSGKTLSSDINAGATQLGSVAIPNTGGWQTWTTVTQTVTLPAGTYNFGINAGTGGWNLNWFSITSAASQIEAENYSTMSGVQTEACSEGGLNVGYIDAGDWMVYPINVPSTGSYTIQYRVASPNSGKTLSSDLNAGAIQLGSVAIPNTGGWQNWTTVSQNVNLNAGSYNFGINAGTGGWNINWFSISGGGVVNPSPSPSPTPTSNPSGFRIVGYMPSWLGDAGAIQYSKLTHINYAFIVPNAQGDGSLGAIDNIPKLQQIVSSAHANGKKVLIAVGGWSDLNNPGFNAISTNATARNNFATNLLNLCNQYGLDGVDIDWEYPQGYVDGYVSMMQVLGTKMHGAGKLLTAAVPGSDYYGQYISSATFGSVDFLNIMAYDGDAGAGHSPYSFAQSALAYWTGKGLPASKAVLGVPFYARPSWKTFAELLAAGASPNADYFNGDYYNGIPTIQAKTALAKGYGGIMIWQIAGDATGTNSLLSAIYNASR